MRQLDVGTFDGLRGFFGSLDKIIGGFPQFLSKTYEASRNTDQQKSENGYPDLGALIPILVLGGLFYGSFELQIAGYGNIDRGRKIYGYGLLFFGSLIGCIPALGVIFGWF